MSPEWKILSYLFFAVSIFFIEDILAFLSIAVVLILFFFRLPLKKALSGWIPICIVLSATFFSHALFQDGKIVAGSGIFILTEEGLTAASHAAVRLFLMIAGAKILTGVTSPEELGRALGNLIRPLRHIGLPVSDLISTMQLTMRFLPRLKEKILSLGKPGAAEEKSKGFTQKAGMVSGLLISLFVQSLESPESFLESSTKAGVDDKKD